MFWAYEINGWEHPKSKQGREEELSTNIISKGNAYLLG